MDRRGIKETMLMGISTTVKPIEDRPRTPSRKRQCISKQRDSRRADDDASDSDSDMDSAEDNISKITDTIGGTVTRLFHLSNAIRNSAKDHQARTFKRDRDDEEEASNAIAELRLDTECYVRFRFPRAPDSLRSALVEANAMRFRRLYYQRSRRCVQSQQTDPTTVRLPEIKESAALVNSKLSFPPMPLDHECPYCGVTVDFRGTAEPTLWHNHVIRDLEPFICVFAPCLEAAQHGTGPQTFATSKAWLSHMQHAHGHTWECRAPSHNPITFDQEIQYKEHAINEHGVPETHAGTLSGAARRPVVLDNKVLECPFGDGFQPSGEVEVELSPVFSSEALQSHVASHMK
ncbi:hypothetical protein BJX61DRAFT_545151 [Aspergillus egyptiacus]|nr:hypothetical protein BJX61DRAFT_545151 [Aspergillus egyptiacus]